MSVEDFEAAGGYIGLGTVQLGESILLGIETDIQLRDCPGSKFRSIASIAGGTSNVGNGVSVSSASSSARIVEESVASKSDAKPEDDEKNPEKIEGERACPDARRGCGIMGGEKGKGGDGDSKENNPEDNETERV